MSDSTVEYASEPRQFDPDQYRMTIGEHLEELRSRLILALAGLAVAFAVCLLFGKTVMAAFCRPLIDCLQEYEINPQIYFTQVSDPFMVFIKIGLVTACAVASPWIVYQLWQFIAAGLYAHERRVVTRYVPLSLTLLIGGMVFVYYLVLPWTLKFFVAFSISIPLPSHFSPNAKVVTTHPTTIPSYAGDPATPANGEIWINTLDGRVKMMIGSKVRVMTFGAENLTSPLITLPDYIDLVFGMLLTFGLSFQLPLLVMALVAVGIVERDGLKASRRYIYFAMAIVAAAITPGDVITATIALMVPLIGLFELGDLAFTTATARGIIRGLVGAKRIAILGAGPIGIEAALYARILGHQVTVYERGEVAENLRQWGFVRLFTPWPMNITPLGQKQLNFSPGNECPTGTELRRQYVLPLSQRPILSDCIRPNTRVITIVRDTHEGSNAIEQSLRAEAPFRILVSDTLGGEHVDTADVLLDCTGTYGNHRWAGRGGMAAPGEASLGERIWYTIPDVLGRNRDLFANRHTLLLGCGYSAATVLCAIEQLTKDSPRTKLSWAIRRPGQALQAIHGDPLPLRRELTVKSLALTRHPPPWLEFLGTCVLEELAPSGTQISATLRSLDKSRALQIDELVALVGYMPDSGIYEQLQVHDPYTPGAASMEALQNPEPGFFILGAKSYGTNSHFLLQIGHKQIADAFRLIQNDPTLNLYEM